MAGVGGIRYHRRLGAVIDGKTRNKLYRGKVYGLVCYTRLDCDFCMQSSVWAWQIDFEFDLGGNYLNHFLILVIAYVNLTILYRDHSKFELFLLYFFNNLKICSKDWPGNLLITIGICYTNLNSYFLLCQSLHPFKSWLSYMITFKQVFWISYLS